MKEVRARVSILKKIGPGFVTGASDDDPSGIATYSQAGALFGYGLLWTLLFSYPLMVAIQEISARIGRVTGRGIAANLKTLYGRRVLYPAVFLLMVSNVVNIGADLQAIGAAIQLLCGGSLVFYCVLVALASAVVEVFVPYRRYVNLLKWAALSLFSYLGVLAVVHVDWLSALKNLCVPHLGHGRESLKMLIAIMGTTISPYLFFWQASQEVEEQEADPREKSLLEAPDQAPAQLASMRVDTRVGMAFSNVIAFAIMLATAVTLHAHGRTEIQSAAEAAQALRPIAGDFCFALFSFGMIASGFLTIPVLAGSAAYAVGETLDWRVGLERKPRDAPAFYAIIAGATLVGLSLVFFRVNPIQALIWTAVLNGIVAVPIMVVTMFAASDARVMGEFVVPKGLKTMGWLATLAMLLSSIGLFLVK